MEKFDHGKSREIESAEVKDTAAWISNMASANEVQERMEFLSCPREVAIEQALTSKFDNPDLDDEGFRRLVDLRNGFVTVAYGNFMPGQQEYYREIMNTPPGACDIVVTDQLREDLATLLAYHDVELPYAAAPPEDELVRALLSPDSSEKS